MAMSTITFRFKDNDSRVSSCPAYYDAVDTDGTPRAIVQGKQLTDGWRDRYADRPGYVVWGTPVSDRADRARLRDLDTDEDAVFVPSGMLAAVAVQPGGFVAPPTGQAAVWVPENVIARALALTPA